MKYNRRKLVIFQLGVLLMISWIIYLRFSLPKTYDAQHWRFAWVGFDFGLSASLIITFIRHYRNNLRSANSAVVASTFLFIDSWFDVITARKGDDRITAVCLALFIQLPLAIFLIRYARKRTKSNSND
jgi:hypothetical protein